MNALRWGGGRFDERFDERCETPKDVGPDVGHLVAPSAQFGGEQLDVFLGFWTWTRLKTGAPPVFSVRVVPRNHHLTELGF